MPDELLDVLLKTSQAPQGFGEFRVCLRFNGSEYFTTVREGASRAEIVSALMALAQLIDEDRPRK